MALDEGVLNTVADIKEELLLETENQTLTDEQIENYLNKARTQMISDLHRAVEEEIFQADASGTIIFTPYFNVLSITSILVNDIEIDAGDYELVYSNDGVSIDNLSEGDEVKIIYIPTNYKVLEKAICMVKILRRLNPFINDVLNPTYAGWIEDQKNFTNVIRRKFGVGKYSG